MTNVLWTVLAVTAATLLIGCAGQSARLQEGEAVRLVRNDAEERVDVFVGNTLFTSYRYDTDEPVMKKPVLYPLRAPDGTVVTRGYPLEPRPGERADHPHHIGYWFNYGNVNGQDYWGHSNASPADRAAVLGTLRHRAIKTVESGDDGGVLEVAIDWDDAQGKTVLREDTRFEFRARPGVWIVDRIATLTAQGTPVTFEDTKEGMLAVRVARGLEHPSDETLQLTDAHGGVTAVPPNNEGVTGQYLSSEGVTGADVWGTRAHWMLLSGEVEDAPVAIALLDHPSNPGYPTYWHARGYGLFAANPFGWKDFTGGKETMDFALKAGESTTFRHRLAVFSSQPTPEEVEALHRSFSGE